MEILNVLLTDGLIVLGLIAFFFAFVLPNYRGWKNRRQPTVTVRATVVGKTKNMDNVIHTGTRDPGDVFLLVFDTADSQRLTLTVPRDVYYSTKEGTSGTLIYQGRKCEKFTPDL